MVFNLAVFILLAVYQTVIVDMNALVTFHS
jgi:hypothetical protein